MTQVLPPNNLPPESVPWGRAVQSEAFNLSRELRNEGEAAGSERRAYAGQMGITGRQLERIQDQSEEIDLRANIPFSVSSGFSVPGPASGVWASSTSDFLIPGTGGDRSSRVEVGIPATGTSSGTGSGRSYLRVTSGTRVLWGSFLMNPGTSRTVTAEFVTVVPDSGLDCKLELFVTSQFDPETFTVTLSPSVGSVTLFNRV